MADQNPNDLAAGWYPDTDLVDTERYWDGKSWTSKRRATNVSADSPTRKVNNSASSSGSSKVAALWQFATGKPGETKGKKWLRRIISFVVFIAIFSALSSNTESTTTDSSSGTESVSPTPAVTTSPTSEATPTESATPTPDPMSPVEFRVSALGDVADMRKDFSDFEGVLNDGGFLRLLGNILELEFNIGQLQSLTPPDEYSVKFTEKLSALELTVDALSDAVTSSESSTSDTKVKLKKCRSALSSLETFLKSVN